MGYDIKFGSKAKRFLKGLDKDVYLRILDKFEEIRNNPFRYLEHYEGKGYKFRIGHYRALIDVDFNEKILKVRILDKRERVYEK